MRLAGKYLLQEFAPDTEFHQALPRNPFVEGKGSTTTRKLGADAGVIQAHPQVAFDLEGLGFSPYYSSY